MVNYSAGGKVYDFDSPANQRIKREFVEREVMACISDFAEYLFDWCGEKHVTYDEFSNYHVPVCSECRCSDGFDEKESEDGDTNWICQSCGVVFSDMEYVALDVEPREVFKRRIVTPWLGQKLEERGEDVYELIEVILDRWRGYIWGHRATGQSILFDYVINQICYNMKILEGQKYSWEGKV